MYPHLLGLRTASREKTETRVTKKILILDKRKIGLGGLKKRQG